jgi:hypothetical protein
MKAFSWLQLALMACLPSLPAQAVTNGYITAVLQSGCASVPSPPPVGQIAIGPGYVIKTVADGDPLNYQLAQQLVTDAIFESLMPLYCGLPRGNCVTNRVQWGIQTFDVNGNSRMGFCPTSGCEYHYCPVTNGYLIAVVAGDSASLPPLPPVGQVAVGTDAVIMTIADGDPTNFARAQQLATDAVFESLMRRYCALPRGTGPGYASGDAQWLVATYDADGNLKLSGCPASGCDSHECVVSTGYIAAVLRSDCSSLPFPPPVGAIEIGPDYVIMTVADGDPLNIPAAQQFATDTVFESLMPLYCTFVHGPCVRDRVQWNLATYDAGGNWKVSAGPTSGPGYHYFDACSLTPRQRIEQMSVWVQVDVTAGILDQSDGKRLTARLNAALRELNRGNTQRAVDRVNVFIEEVDKLVNTGQLPEPAAHTLTNAAAALVRELGG